MIKYDTTKNNNSAQLIFGGNISEIICEVMAMIKCMYINIKKDDEIVAETFKKYIIKDIGDCFTVCEEIEKCTNETNSSFEEKLITFFDLLHEFTEDCKKNGKEVLEDVKLVDLNENDAFMKWLQNRHDNKNKEDK